MRNPFSVLRGTYARWLAANPVLNSGEFGYDTDRKLLKIGDGVTAWASLPTITMAYQEVTGTTQACVNGMRYGPNNVGLVTLTLPTTAPVGMRLAIIGVGAGGWKLAQNALQLVHVGGGVSTTGVTGYITSSNRYDCIELTCTVANTEWTATSVIGTLTVV